MTCNNIIARNISILENLNNLQLGFLEKNLECNNLLIIYLGKRKIEVQMLSIYIHKVGIN